MESIAPEMDRENKFPKNKIEPMARAKKSNSTIEDIILVESGLVDPLPDLPLVPTSWDLPFRDKPMAYLTLPQVFAFLSSIQCLKTFGRDLLNLDPDTLPSLYLLDLTITRGESLFDLFAPLYVRLVKWLGISMFKQSIKQDAESKDTESLDEYDLQTIAFFENITRDTVQPYLADLLWQDSVPRDVFPELFSSDQDADKSSSQRTLTLLELLEKQELPLLPPFAHVCLLKLLCDKLLTSHELQTVLRSLEDSVTTIRQMRWKRAGERRALEAEIGALETEISQLSDKLVVDIKEEASSKLVDENTDEKGSTARQHKVRKNKILGAMEEDVASELRSIQAEHNRKVLEVEKKQSAVDVLLADEDKDREAVERLKSQRRSATKFELGLDRFGRRYFWLDLHGTGASERSSNGKLGSDKTRKTAADAPTGSDDSESEADVNDASSLDDEDQERPNGSKSFPKESLEPIIEEESVEELDEVEDEHGVSENGLDEAAETPNNADLSLEYSGPEPIEVDLDANQSAFGLVIEMPSMQVDYFELPFENETPKKSVRRPLNDRPAQVFAPPRRRDYQAQGFGPVVAYEPAKEIDLKVARHHRWFFVPHWLCLETLYSSLSSRGAREHELKARLAKKCSDYGIKLGHTLKQSSKPDSPEGQLLVRTAQSFESGLARFSDWLQLRGQLLSSQAEPKPLVEHYLPLIQQKLSQCARLYRVPVNKIPDLETEIDPSTSVAACVDEMKGVISSFFDDFELDLFAALELKNVRSKTTHKPISSDDEPVDLLDMGSSDEDSDVERYRHSFYLYRPWRHIARRIERKSGAFLEMPRFLPLSSVKTLSSLYAWLSELHVKAEEKGSGALLYKVRQATRSSFIENAKANGKKKLSSAAKQSAEARSESQSSVQSSGKRTRSGDNNRSKAQRGRPTKNSRKASPNTDTGRDKSTRKRNAHERPTASPSSAETSSDAGSDHEMETTPKANAKELHNSDTDKSPHSETSSSSGKDSMSESDSSVSESGSDFGSEADAKPKRSKSARATSQSKRKRVV